MDRGDSALGFAQISVVPTNSHQGCLCQDDRTWRSILNHFTAAETTEKEFDMGDITDFRLLYLKGAMFVGLGCLAAGLILVELPNLRSAFLLAVAIWSFCRAYYFAFYVIQHYVDPTFRFAGLSSFALYLWRKRHSLN